MRIALENTCLFFGVEHSAAWAGPQTHEKLSHRTIVTLQPQLWFKALFIPPCWLDDAMPYLYTVKIVSCCRFWQRKFVFELLFYDERRGRN